MEDNKTFGVFDEKNRPLIKMKKEGTFIFIRYPDMSKNAKSILKVFYTVILKNDASACDHLGNQLGDIDGFIDFKETDDICG